MIDGVKLDLARMQARKTEVVTANVKGVEFLFKKNKVTWLKGSAKLAGEGKVDVDGTVYGAKHIVIATGSESVPLPGVAVDEKRIVSSTGALELDTVPQHLVVIGGGYIGLELGSVWHRLGADVTVVEYLDRLVPGMDGEVGKAFERVLAKQGLKFRLGTKVTGAQVGDGGVTLTVEKATGDRRRNCRRTWFWWQSAAALHQRAGTGSSRCHHRSTGLRSPRTRITRPTRPASTPSVTSRAGRCWHTRRGRRGGVG